MRRQAFSTVRPFSKGRSLKAVSLLSDDPCWRAACAPLLRWSKEIWLAQTHVHPFSVQHPELRRNWLSVFALPRFAWPTVRGPLSALRLTLERLGWTMDDY
eukprot:3029578-Pyramimonas_sp.AAC.1